MSKKLCVCDTCRKVKKDLEDCLCVNHMYKWIIDSYVLDYYLNDHWSLLPKSWKNAFEGMPFRDMAKILDIQKPLQKPQTVYPLSILALRLVMKNVVIPTIPECTDNVNEMNEMHVASKTPAGLRMNSSLRVPNRILDNRKLNKLFWTHAKPKKIHEISIMAEICAANYHATNCNLVLDFGSGIGHLSRLLSYAYNIQVCSLEVQRPLISQANNLDVKFENFAKMHMNATDFVVLKTPLLYHIKLTHEANIDGLLEDIRARLGLDELRLGIIGLHPCGDLATILLDFFKKSNKVKFINLVSCCYMKISTEGDYIGYPMSEFLLSKDNASLSYNTREMSCHAMESYILRLKSDNYSDLKIHSYRATLETLIIKHYPDKRHIGLRSVKSRRDLDFVTYCSKATQGLDLNIPFEDINSAEVLEKLLQWENVALFYCLRLLFAPMIETIMLSDRFLYVAEPDVKCKLVPVFDPKLSPRNHVLIARKHLE